MRCCGFNSGALSHLEQSSLLLIHQIKILQQSTLRIDLRQCNTKDHQLSLHIAMLYIWLRRSCCGEGEARQRGSPGGIRQVKVNRVSEIAPVGSAVHGRVVHVQVKRGAQRRRKSAQEQRDTKQRAAEEGDRARRLYAHSPRTHCFEVDSVRAQLV